MNESLEEFDERVATELDRQKTEEELHDLQKLLQTILAAGDAMSEYFVGLLDDPVIKVYLQHGTFGYGDDLKELRDVAQEWDNGVGEAQSRNLDWRFADSDSDVVYYTNEEAANG